MNFSRMVIRPKWLLFHQETAVHVSFPEKGELLPPFASSKGGNLYLFCPLHFREREIGYLAFKNCDYILKNQFLFEMLAAFQIALEALYGKLTLHKMNAALSQLSHIRDSLTGLYNRMAYDKLAIPLFASSISSAIPAVFFLQMLISSNTSMIPLGTTWEIWPSVRLPLP